MYNRKRNLWRRWCRSKRIDDKQKYQRYATRCKHAVESYNATRELELVNCNDIGQFYKFVNRKLSVRKSIPPIKSADGSLLSNSLDQADAFNQYFC